MSFRHIQSKLVSAVAAATLACSWGAAQAASATVSLNASLLGALSFLGATVSGAGTGVSYTGGVFDAPLAGVSLASPGVGPVTVNWSADASLTIASASATAVFSGLSFDAATSEITADIAFSSPSLTTTFNDVGFLIVKNTEGSIGGSLGLGSVSATGTPVPITFSGTGYFDTVSLAPVIAQLGVPASLTATLAATPAATIAFSGSTTVTAPNAVPEPATAWSFLLGAGLLAGLVRRRRAA